MADDVVLETRDGVLVIVLNRPRVCNAVNLSMAEGIAEAVERLDSQRDLRIGVITGADGNFSSGMDLGAFVRGEKPVVGDRGFAGITARPPRKPLIAAVEGYALAGGCEIVLSCDLVVAAEGAVFGVPEVKRGLVPGAGGVVRLPRRLPYHIAMELALTGDSLTAVRAERLGFVNRLCEDGQALDQALGLAARIKENAPLALEAAKRVVQESWIWSEDEWPEQQEPFIGHVQNSEDAIEGSRAFSEKRRPHWKGR